MPKSLLGRSLMIIITPLILLQIIAAGIFFESHWDKVTYRLARGVAGEVSSIIKLLEHFGKEREGFFWVQSHAEGTLGLIIELEPGKFVPTRAQTGDNNLERMLIRALHDILDAPFKIDNETLKRDVLIDVQFVNNTLRIKVPRKRLFSSTTYVFVLWMVGSSLILFVVAMIFMRNQVKPIRRLADAADDFGKGRSVKEFKLEGANEVRQAGAAFVVMRDRILRQISQRTDMLTGVSHDLRTPLTRMRLQLEMMGDEEGISDLQKDVGEMERMLDGYLAFARGEGNEKEKNVNLFDSVTNIAEQFKRQGKTIEILIDGNFSLKLAPNAFRRTMTNLIENASRFADNIYVCVRKSSGGAEIFIDDDGPGIPVAERVKVFRPFYRIEQSRNPGTGGVGLGMAIARDFVQGHGGEIKILDSPRGGAQIKIVLPT